MAVGAEAQNREATNNVVSLTQAKSALPAGRDEAKCDEVLIHVRFHPNLRSTQSINVRSTFTGKIGSFACAMGPP